MMAKALRRMLANGVIATVSGEVHPMRLEAQVGVIEAGWVSTEMRHCVTLGIILGKDRLTICEHRQMVNINRASYLRACFGGSWTAIFVGSVFRLINIIAIRIFLVAFYVTKAPVSIFISFDVVISFRSIGVWCLTTEGAVRHREKDELIVSGTKFRLELWVLPISRSSNSFIENIVGRLGVVVCV